MVKTAYQKLCFYPLVRVAVVGVLLSVLLYQFHGLLSAGDELVARVFWGALPGIRRSARVFACGGRGPLCDPGPAGKPPSARSPQLCAGAAGPGSANRGPAG